MIFQQPGKNYQGIPLDHGVTTLQAEDANEQAEVGANIRGEKALEL